MTKENINTSFYKKFQRTEKQRLKFHNNRKYHTDRLPFCSTKSYWIVPERGGVFGGSEAGGILSLIYLKHLRENETNGHFLKRIVFDMFKDYRGHGEHHFEMDKGSQSRKAQIEGFFKQLEILLIDAAINQWGGLDKFDNKMLLKDANCYLNFDEDAYFLDCKIKYEALKTEEREAKQKERLDKKKLARKRKAA